MGRRGRLDRKKWMASARLSAYEIVWDKRPDDSILLRTDDPFDVRLVLTMAVSSETGGADLP